MYTFSMYAQTFAKSIKEVLTCKSLKIEYFLCVIHIYVIMNVCAQV